MKLIRGSNAPIKLTFNEDVEQFPYISILMYKVGKKETISFEKSDLVADGNTLLIPMTQTASIDFGDGLATMEIKAKDADGLVRMYEKVPICIKSRKDETVLGEDNAYTDEASVDEIPVIGSETVIIKRGYSPFIDSESGTWFVYDDEQKAYVDTHTKAVGKDGTDYVITDADYDAIANKVADGVTFKLLSDGRLAYCYEE